MSPHDGTGGCTPRPRNDSAASSRMALAASMVATTNSCGAMFGRISPRIIRVLDAPMHSAAAT
jgi:hypothetical protein